MSELGRQSAGQRCDHLTPAVRALLADLTERSTAEARRLFYLQHPIICSGVVVEQLATALPSFEGSIDPVRARQVLQELGQFSQGVRGAPGLYPIGVGPLEGIWQRVARGEIREDRALALAEEPDTTGVLSEEYAGAVGRWAARSSGGNEWKQAKLLHQLLLAGARACRTPEARGVRIRAEREWLVTATNVLMHLADGRVYRDALEGGEWLIRALEEDGRDELLAETLHYLGVLHLDPYTSFRRPENQAFDYDMWVAQTVLELGADATAGIPTTVEALRRAEAYLKRAADVATGRYRGYALKALMQAMTWRRDLGERVRGRELRRVVRRAIGVLDPMEDPERWLRCVAMLRELGGKTDGGRVAAVLSIPLSEWVERLGRDLAVQLVPALVHELGERDPWAALRVAEEAGELITQVPREEQRQAFLQQELAIFSRIGSGRAGRRGFIARMRRRTASRGVSNEFAAAFLVARALETGIDDHELMGLAMLDEAERLSPALARSHHRALLELRATLWLGAACNAVGGDPPNVSEAVRAYGNALQADLELGFSGRVLEILRRLEDLARKRDAGSTVPILMVLLALSLPCELVAGEPAAAVVRAICRQLTMALLHGAEVLPVVWQVAKGRRWAAALTGGVRRRPQDDESSNHALKDLGEAQRLLGGDEVEEGRIASDPALFETWLTSYARTERYDGDRDWERVANLKMTFDERVARVVAEPCAYTPCSPLAIETLQAELDPSSVLLIAYVGEYTDGRPATFDVLVTRDEVKAHGHVPDLDSREFEARIGERTAQMSAVGVYVGTLRRELLTPPGKRLVSAEAAESLRECLRFLFGELNQDLERLRAAGKNHLIVSPHDALHFAPFHLFSPGGVPLADHWTVTYLPNLAQLSPARRNVGAGKRGDGSAVIGLSFAAGEGGWPPLDEAAQEVQSVADVLGVKPLLDADAGKQAVLQALEHSARVHIATHGSIDVDAPSLQSVVLYPPEDEQAQLHAHEILNLDLSGLELVTLSACETALGRVDRSDNVRGLSAALFSARVSTVVGTLWQVESGASEVFFTSFYREFIASRSCLAAFRHAQERTRREYPQYIDWGPFYLAGAWR